MRNRATALAVAGLLLISGAAPVVAAEGNEELRRIDRTLREILATLADQNRQIAERDESRLLLQRLDLQGDRLIPLEDQLTQLRLRRSELQQSLAVSAEKEYQLKESAEQSEFSVLILSQAKAERRQQETIQSQLNSLEVQIRDREGEMLVERGKFDELAARIDERLGIGG